MRKLRVAQIGTSETAHAGHIMKALLNMPEEYEVLGVANVDRHPYGLRDPIFKSVPLMTVDEIFSLDLDAIFIEADEVLQTKYAMMAVERGMHVSVDKPGSQGDREFDELFNKAEENGTVLFMNYMYRYNPAVMYAREKIKNGDIGDIISIEAQMNCYHYPGFRNVYSDLKGGVMYYLGCHMTDIIFGTLGEPNAVHTFNRNTGDPAVKSIDFGLALLSYDKGVSIAKVNASEVAGAPLRRSIIFSGTKGTLEIRPIERPIQNGFDVSEIYENYLGDENIYHRVFAPYGRYTHMLREFAALVRGDKTETPYTYDYERRLHKLILRTCDATED